MSPSSFQLNFNCKSGFSYSVSAFTLLVRMNIAAIANAENNNNSDIDKLSVKSVIVNQGMRLKRMKARARGRADRIIKPTCHIEIILVEETN